MDQLLMASIIVMLIFGPTIVLMTTVKGIINWLDSVLRGKR